MADDTGPMTVETSGTTPDSVTAWLLDSDPAIRWQALRDLTDAPAADVAAERERVAHEGWGAALLAARDPDGQWLGGACFRAAAYHRPTAASPGPRRCRPCSSSARSASTRPRPSPVR
jgi:hypothetical protein